MTETAIVTRGNVQLAAYGDIEEVRELTRRILTMLPGAKDLGPYGAGALAQASLAMGLNPLIGEVWAIPQGGRQNDGTHKSYAIMVGIKGLRTKAHEQARADHGMFTVHFRSPTEDEMYGVKLNNGDIARACDLVVSGDRAARHHDLTGEVPRYVGIGVYRGGESTKMHPLQVARKRAEADAIKQAYDVPLSFVSGGAQQVDIEVEDEPEQYEENGDGLVRGNAQDAIDDLYGEYVEEDGYTGAAPGPDTREDLRADESRRAPTAAREWPKATIDAVMDAGFARPAKHAVKMLSLSDVLHTTDEIELVLTWANHYRGQREDGAEPQEAAKYADAQLQGINN